ncbi:transporter substrate-binding domain-containing protein [Desulfoluna sp.]|uniref:ATP-binding protein n=1 Tax=Desulfoluna sp. TaxID=2045199 RepID=UPI002603A764|nr:transporter substrate-binding domain-containing protein [Desulfoluna sp.]
MWFQHDEPLSIKIKKEMSRWQRLQIACRKGWGDAWRAVRRHSRWEPLFLAASLFLMADAEAGRSLRVGIFQNYPLVFQDDQGTARGIYIDLLEEIAKKENWTLIYVPDTWNNCLENLRSGRIDLMTSITSTQERKAYLHFSRENVLMMWGQVYTRKDLSIQTILDMQGLRVAILKGGINGINFKKLIGTFNVRCDIIPFNTYAEIFQSLASGQVDAGVVNNVSGKALEETYGLTSSPILFNPFSLLFAVPAGTDDHLLTILDKHLKTWKQDKGSFYYTTLKAWYGKTEATKTMMPPWVFYLLGGGCFLVMVLFVWMRLLNHQVKTHTHDLTQTNTQLKKEITERQRAEDNLRVSNKRYLSLFENSPVPLWEEDFSEIHRHLEKIKNEIHTDLRTHFSESPSELLACAQKIKIMNVNQATLDLHQANEKEELLGNLDRIFTKKSLEVFKEEVLALAEGKTEYESEAEVKTLNGDILQILLRLKIDYEQENTVRGLLATPNITERKRGEAEREKLKNQLLHAQKMESVGRLAGGVAHDYNNALSVIIGFTELAMDHGPPSGPLHDHLTEVIKAAKHATEITRQLLAFARKQAIAPISIDLNHSIEGMLKMLRRLIGEDIELLWRPSEPLWALKMDPSQIDQILANLCVNARDAIKDTGTITLETGTTTLDELYCQAHAGFVPGDYVVLVVSDTGCGMEKEVLDNIFDPFFTTKEVDEGTGLGLATVYGIVKQNKGLVSVYSEPNRGTTIRIFLRRHTETPAPHQSEASDHIPSAHGETILLVEDDLAILKLAQKTLEILGYQVLTAAKPNLALEQAKTYTHNIDLLITDVIMPVMNGHELATKLRPLYPAISVLYMSGYTADVIAHHGVLDTGVHFIQKPFSKMGMAKAIRSALDENKDDPS